MTKPVVLFVEDNLTLRQQLAEYFEPLDWRCDFADTGALALQLGARNHYDVVVLDLGLPDCDGVEICRALKSMSARATPVLMLTARDSLQDKTVGFHAGADDYLTKPFLLPELKLRCEALCRRQALHQQGEIEIGDLLLKVHERRAYRAGCLLELTQLGFNILLTLAKAHPAAVTRSILTHALWGDEPPASDALRSHIYALRQVLDKPFVTPMLTTVTQVGYRLERVNDG
ncbi:response regulator transcription factor [Simiduia aestuariiviva]|uniref:DNA-binding response OmpR family regulator n=1 Tax=Simiduia aestuariiviva TaxID=1510459 RepID=A0A839UP03_9GAMM|nr:response regulator transcription factor [Simiduia aestuariiviva]MBB3167115.1 DNA-binding response OmpR family regulator [Simiduia aestuariiviva]